MNLGTSSSVVSRSFKYPISLSLKTEKTGKPHNKTLHRHTAITETLKIRHYYSSTILKGGSSDSEERLLIVGSLTVVLQNPSLRKVEQWFA